MWLYLSWRITIFLSRRLPSWLLYWTSRRTADLSYLLDRRGRRAVFDNLRKMLPGCPPHRIRVLARRTFRSHARTLVEFFGTQSLSDRFLEEKCEVAGIPVLDEAMSKGRGVIIVSAHIANWQLAAALLTRLGYPLAMVVQTHPNPKVDGLFETQRRIIGAQVIHVETAAMGTHRWLKNKHIVCLLGDRDLSGTGVEVRFFNQRTLFPQGPARLALAHECPILLVHMFRKTDGRYVLTLANLPEPHGSRRDKVLQLVQSWADAFEEVLREDPSQWSNFYTQWPDEPAQNGR